VRFSNYNFHKAGRLYKECKFVLIKAVSNQSDLVQQVIFPEYEDITAFVSLFY